MVMDPSYYSILLYTKKMWKTNLFRKMLSIQSDFTQKVRLIGALPTMSLHCRLPGAGFSMTYVLRTIQVSR